MYGNKKQSTQQNDKITFNTVQFTLQYITLTDYYIVKDTFR